MGTFVTGNTSLPAAKTDANTPTGATTELAAADINNLWNAAADLRTAVEQRVCENILPNSEWKIATAIGVGTKMKADGSGEMSTISVSSYTTGANQIVCLTSNTQDVKVGDLVRFDSSADANMRIVSPASNQCANRVEAVTTNTSFTISLPHKFTAAASAATVATIVDCGGSASNGTGDSFDGWTKSTTLQVWREDNSVNLLGGAIYSKGILKGSSSAETVYYSVPTREIRRYLGKNIAFGMYVRQKIKGGAGTWRLFIATNGTGGTTTYSSIAASQGYTWNEVSIAVPSDATSISMGISTDGATSDVYYICQPMAGRGTYIGPGNYFAPKDEILIPKVKVSLATFFGSNIVFPTVASASGDYGFKVRPHPECEFPGAFAPTIKKLHMQIEARCDGPIGVNSGAAGAALATRNNEDVPHIYAMLRYCTGAYQMQAMEGDITLDTNGDFWMYSNLASSSYTDTAHNWYSCSIDINGFEL